MTTTKNNSQPRIRKASRGVAVGVLASLAVAGSAIAASSSSHSTPKRAPKVHSVAAAVIPGPGLPAVKAKNEPIAPKHHHHSQTAHAASAGQSGTAASQGSSSGYSGEPVSNESYAPEESPSSGSEDAYQQASEESETNYDSEEESINQMGNGADEQLEEQQETRNLEEEEILPPE